MWEFEKRRETKGANDYRCLEAYYDATITENLWPTGLLFLSSRI
jgi:hypothetical protein